MYSKCLIIVLSSNNIPTHLQKLKSDDWGRWNWHMQATFGFQEVLEVIQNGVPTIGGEATNAQRTTYRENKKIGWSHISFIRALMSHEVNFDKNLSCTSSKDAWNTL
ncbi:unnamed protein product [Trifolium pratense]|uniref:Uncharacterized protein n=1 Tax=Trifolium pratense TaxID=57577 RepID=A0ACB0IGX6_TRIPR|nr:unnamed protein product [Trifolium pratense]